MIIHKSKNNNRKIRLAVNVRDIFELFGCKMVSRKKNTQTKRCPRIFLIALV